MRDIASAIGDLNAPEPRLDDMLTAVAEACLNAIEHGNGERAELPVQVTFLVCDDKYALRVRDCGAGIDAATLRPPAKEENVRTKLGWDNPRGWGMRLMRHCADSIHTGFETDGLFYVELQFARSGLGKGERDE
ncbi:MAG: ATP-binding protein [Paenibacillaceae bacterium]|nr:ATP-binding protein [Paenibacillaceae bacterium]